MHKGALRYIKHLTDDIKELVQQRMLILLEGIKGVMSGVSDAVASAGYESRLKDTKMVAQIGELSQEVKVVKRAADNWAGDESVVKVKASEKKMERKVGAACSTLKYLDRNRGYAAYERRDIVGQVVNVRRTDTYPEERTGLTEA